jgi:dipeptidyl aminopeptidase/acylaminoacyl peptidase
MNTDNTLLIAAAFSAFLLASCSPDTGPKPAPEVTDELAGQVAKMGAIGFSYGGRFSPDGQRIAYISNASGVPNVWLAEANGGNRRQLTQSEDQVDGLAWSPVNDTFALTIAPGGGLNRQIYLMRANGGEPRMISAGGKVNNFLGEWSDDGRYLNYSSNADGDFGMDCWLYDSESDESLKIAENSGIGGCFLSPDNRLAVVWRMVSRGNSDLYLLDLETGSEQHLTPHLGVALSQGFFFLDEHTLLLGSNIDREMMALAKVDLHDGVAGPLQFIAGRDDADLAGAERLAEGRVILNWNASGRSELQYLDPATGETSRGPDLPAEIGGASDVSTNGTRLLFSVSGAATPSNVHLLDSATGEFTRISATPHEGVDLASLVQPELKTYTAHDGLELSGWLYRPNGASGPGPMVLSFHGGPEGQERPRFRATYQALLSRGIAVFAPNVRGSSGFGKTFVNLDNGALRFDGIKDIESTARFVTETGLAEPGRLGIMGGSYGGYMVMAGITDYPELFAAGANLFGIVNFETFFAQTEPWMAAISTVEYGNPETEKELLQQLSPIHRIDRIVTPTLVLHGANDTNVPVVEAEQVVKNLQARGVPVKYVLFADEGHGWGKVENRVTSDVEIVRWFEQHL